MVQSATTHSGGSIEIYMNIILCTSQDIGPKLVKTFSELPQVNLLVLTQETERDRMYGYQSTPKYCKEHNIHYKEPSKYWKYQY